jgi:hypothetical protein
MQGSGCVLYRIITRVCGHSQQIAADTLRVIEIRDALHYHAVEAIKVPTELATRLARIKLALDTGESKKG